MDLKINTLDCLKQMGWWKDRCVDPAGYLNCLSKDGYELFPAAQTFLESFGGLDGVMPPYHKSNGTERVHFNPVEAIDSICRERVALYEERVGEKLIVVGEAYNGHLTILLSANARLYGCYDDYLCLLGNTAIEAMIVLFERQEAKEIA